MISPGNVTLEKTLIAQSPIIQNINFPESLHHYNLNISHLNLHGRVLLFYGQVLLSNRYLLGDCVTYALHLTQDVPHCHCGRIVAGWITMLSWSLLWDPKCFCIFIPLLCFPVIIAELNIVLLLYAHLSHGVKTVIIDACLPQSIKAAITALLTIDSIEPLHRYT